MRTIILTRGHDKENQEERCLNHALSKGYDVLAVVESVDDIASMIVNEKIDVLLTSHVSRITRNYLEYIEICNMLRGYGVAIEIAEKAA